MNSLSGLKNYNFKNTVTLFLLILIFIDPHVYAGNDILPGKKGVEYSPDEKENSYEIRDGKIVKKSCSSVEIADIDGRVEHLFCSGNELYYIKIEQDGDINNAVIGYINTSLAGSGFERGLPADITDYSIIEFTAFNGVVYILCLNNTLYRISINRMDISERKNVEDMAIINGQPVILEKYAEIACLNNNGIKIPLLISGKISIRKVVENRIIFISNGRDTEIIDAINMKSLYQYSDMNEYLMPESYNLVIATVDEFKDGEKIKLEETEKLIFYKIYINGVDMGRTETGLSHIIKSFEVKIDPGMYHIIKIERWELDRKKYRYIRANNIYQPEPLHLYIPDNRIFRVEVRFNGSKYTFIKSIVSKQVLRHK